MNTEDENTVGRISGALFLALLKGFSEEGAKAAVDALYGWADSPNIREEDARILRCVADSATDTDTFPAVEDKPRLHLVSTT